MAKRNENASGAETPEAVQTETATAAGTPAAREPEAPAAKTENDTVTVSLRHTSPYPKYHRAGLALTNRFQDFRITKEQLAILEKDVFVEVKKS